MWMLAYEEGDRIMRLPLFREAMRNSGFGDMGAQLRTG
jgi:hypothetical protein